MNNLTIEDLRREFHEVSSDRSFGLALSGIASLTQHVQPNLGFSDPRLKAIPTMRFADEEALTRQVQNLASIVGTEKFYLTVGKLLHERSAVVGLKPDGIVAKSEAEKITAGEILKEKLQETYQHDQNVFNPSVAEFLGMMSEIEDLKAQQAKLQKEIEHRVYENALDEGKTIGEAERESKKQAINEAVNVSKKYVVDFQLSKNAYIVYH